MSFVVTRRTREIGIRLALGATGASAIRLVLRDAVAMITTTDPATVAAAAMVLAAGALAAAFIPALRASNVSSADALRLD